MNYIKLFFTILVFQTYNGYSQIYDSPLLKPQFIPEEIIMTSNAKTEHFATNESFGTSRNEMIVTEKFIKQSNYQIDQLFKNGKVFFECEATNYVKEIIRKLLKDDLALANSIKIYIVKSPYINAFATNRKEIFINLGLFSKLKNEAQLAYIIAHEIVHIKKQHSLKKHLLEHNINLESENVVKIESDNTLLSKHNYSVSAEREADVLAFEIFKNSGYSTEDLEDIFTILLYAHMPLDGEAIDIEEIFHNQMPLSNNFKSKFPDIAVFSENDINDESTHPSLLERKNTLNAALENIQTVNKDSFLVSENTFKAIKTLSQESLSFLFLSSNQIIEAIYSAARIKSLYEEKEKIESIKIIKALYKYLVMLNHEKYNILDEENKKGELKKIQLFLSSLTPIAVAKLGIINIERLIKIYPTDVELTTLHWMFVYELSAIEIKENEIKEISKVVAFDSSKVATINVEQIENSKEIVKPSVTGRGHVISKPIEIKAKENKADTILPVTKKDENIAAPIPLAKKNEVKKRKPFALMGINEMEAVKVELLNEAIDSIFEAQKDTRMYASALVKAKQEKLNRLNQGVGLENQLSNKKSNKGNIHLKESFVFPSLYMKIDLDNGSDLIIDKSDAGRATCINAFTRADSVLPLKLHLLDVYNFTKDDIENYLDLSAIADWVSETHMNPNIVDIPSDFYMIKKVSEKSNNLLLTGTINAGKARPFKAELLLIASFVYLPWYLIKGSRIQNTVQFSALFDIKKGMLVWKDFVYLKKQGDSKGITSINIYNTLRYLHE